MMVLAACMCTSPGGSSIARMSSYAVTTWKSGMARDMQETVRSIIETAGGTFFTTAVPNGSPPYGIADGGVIIHELGTARMGTSPKTSVLNKYCQAHDVKNLFVTDAASFVTNPDKNPTLTIMAFSWMASEYLLDQAKKGIL